MDAQHPDGGGNGNNSATEAADSKTAVVSAVGPRRWRPRLGKRVLMAGLAIILVTAAVAGAYWYKQRKDAPPKRTPVPFVSEKQSITDINGLLAEGKTQAAVDAVNNNKELAGSRDGQMLLGQTALNKADYDNAVSIYKGVAEKYGWTPNLARLIAGAYESKGDKAQAITYYQKEVELLGKDTTNPMRGDDIARANERIKELQK